jgi:hypothetical protein
MRGGNDVRQLHRAVDLRVRGEDLLEQCRAGPRQPDDENGIPIVTTNTGFFLEQFPGTGFYLALHGERQSLRVVTQSGPSQLIALDVTGE